MNEQAKQVLERIESLQRIQKTHPPKSAEWQSASDELAPLFAEMAKLAQEAA